MDRNAHEKSFARPLGFVLLSAALFGAATPASKLLLRDLSAFQFAGLLYLGAALGVAPAAWCKGGLRLPVRSDRRNRGRLLGAMVAGGVLGPVLLLLGLKLAMAASVSLWLNFELAATTTVITTMCTRICPLPPGTPTGTPMDS